MRASLSGGRRLLGLVAVIVTVAAACSVEDTLSIPNCTDGGSGLIAAQSVPTAELVPCFVAPPAGWEVDAVKIDQSGTAIEFESDRAGSGAASFHYGPACDVDEAVSVPTDQVGTLRYEHVDRVEPGYKAQRYYVFEGGCVWWEFDFDDDVSAALSLELANSLRFITRQALNDSVRESFIDEEL
jgi:hypothetical protein